MDDVSLLAANSKFPALPIKVHSDVKLSCYWWVFAAGKIISLIVFFCFKVLGRRRTY
jgi:hypothetical protein